MGCRKVEINIKKRLIEGLQYLSNPRISPAEKNMIINDINNYEQ